MSTSLLDDVDIFVWCRKVIFFPCVFFQNLHIGLTFFQDLIQFLKLIPIIFYAIVLASEFLFTVQVLRDRIS